MIDPWGVQVGRYPTEEAAKKDVERCKTEDAMYETAKQLVDAAMTAHAEMFGISREKASYWIRTQRGRDRGVNVATVNSVPLDGLNRGMLPVYVWF